MSAAEQIAAPYIDTGIRSDDRARWLAARELGVGGSEIAPALGESRWKSALRLWLEKTGRAEPTHDDADQTREWGLRLEEPLLAWYRERTGLDAKPSRSLLRARSRPHLLSTLDATTEVSGIGRIPLELKTCSERKADEWADGVPREYVLQLHAQMVVLDAPAARIAVLIGGQHAGWHHVERDERIVRHVLDGVDRFWERVLRDEQPEADGSEDARRALQLLHPTSDEGRVAMLDGDLVEVSREIDLLADQIAAAEKRRRALEARVMAAIGGAERGELADGSAWTWKTQTRKAHQVKESTFRVLRRVVAKEG